MEFQTIFANVRPARIAVLIDQTSPNWHASIQYILEFLTQVWGGKHAIIIPTDGKIIAPMFHSLLRAFDPDYIYAYQKTGRDDQLADPEGFRSVAKDSIARLIQSHVDDNNASIVKEIERELLEKRYEFEIDKDLKARLARKLVPFNSQGNIAGIIRAEDVPPHQLTAVVDLIFPGILTEEIIIARNSTNELPYLWYASVVGIASPKYLKQLELRNTKPKEIDFQGNDVQKLVRFVVSKGNADLAPWWNTSKENVLSFRNRLPFSVAMMNLSYYALHTYQESTEPVVAVAGNRLEDFCLYFNLSSMRNRVVWVLPSITDKALAGRLNYDLHETHFAAALEELSRGDNQHEEGLLFTSSSLTENQLNLVRSTLSKSLSASTLEVPSRVAIAIEPLIKSPLRVYETGNLERDQTKIVVDEELPGYFETPKPKGVASAIPSKLRWITELKFSKYHLPQHPAVAQLLVDRDPLLTLAAIKRSSKESFLYIPELCFFKKAEDEKPWMEADILCVSDGILVIGEAKSADKIDTKSSDEKASLQKYMNLATELGARRVVFATLCQSWSPGTEANINSICRESGFEIIKLTSTDLLRPLADDIN